MLDSGQSMMDPDALLPVEYSQIETEAEALEAATNEKLLKRTLRTYIVWDNELGNFPLEEVLLRMRETGAAMVTKVEEVS